MKYVLIQFGIAYLLNSQMCCATSQHINNKNNVFLNRFFDINFERYWKVVMGDVYKEDFIFPTFY